MALREHTIDGFSYKYREDKISCDLCGDSFYLLTFCVTGEHYFGSGFTRIYSGIFLNNPEQANRLSLCEAGWRRRTVSSELDAFDIDLWDFEILNNEIVFVFKNNSNYKHEVFHPIYIFLDLMTTDSAYMF
jgi:hypothetical protein